jgi:ceramide glucosyltransferase
VTLSLFLRMLEWVFLIPAVCGSVYGILCMLTVIRLRTARRRPPAHSFAAWPAVTVLKPVYGLEKNLRENLRSICRQDYPNYQVVFSVQRHDDPAIHLLREMEQEFGSAMVSVAIEECRAGSNGKINNLIGGLKYARHDILVIGDSDILVQPDYLKTIVAPLADPEVGFVCTLYKAAFAHKWYEKLELLTANADLMPNIIFAHITGATKFCLGASTALRRSMLEKIGGLESLADYLVEDFEMGRRIWSLGKKDIIVPYFVETIMDLKSPRQWWGHQVYWDQNHRSARPGGFSSTVLIRSVPFAFLYAAVRLGDATGLAVLLGALFLRLTAAAVILGWGLRDREGLRSLYLLPFRDLAGLLSFTLAYTQRTTVWRESHFVLTRDGRLISQQEKP